MYTSMGRDEFQDATRMAQEDERRMGVLPTANRVELVSKYLCVHYIRSCTAALLLTSGRRVLCVCASTGGASTCARITCVGDSEHCMSGSWSEYGGSSQFDLQVCAVGTCNAF